MKLPKCSTCNYSFRWKELYYKFGSKKCPNCGVYQYVTAEIRRKGMWAVLIASVLTAVFNQLTDIPNSISFPIVISLLVFALLINPYFLEFTEKEEPLF